MLKLMNIWSDALMATGSIVLQEPYHACAD